MAFKDRLKEAMSQGGFTQASLAKATGLAQSMIWKLASGNAAGTSKIVEISRALNVRPEWLSEGTGPMRDEDAAPLIIKYSSLFPVDVYDGEQKTGSVLMVPDLVQNDNCKAYQIAENTGCAEVPAGTYIVVDSEDIAGDKDLVYARISETQSVYRMVRGGTHDFLAVDDSRVPLIPITDDVSVIGVIVFILRGIKRR